MLHYPANINTLRCRINGGVKINRGSKIFVKFNKQWGGGGGGGAVGISKNPLISVMNKKRDMCNIDARS